MPERNKVYDVVIVGGSFAGLAAATQLARARRTILVLDGGKPRNRFSKHSYGFLGQDGKTPAEILSTARQQLLRYPTVTVEMVEARDAAKVRDTFRIALVNGKEVETRRIVLASGVQDHLPEIPGMRELWGVSVFHCPYCHGYEVAGRPLGVLGSSDAAFHQAAMLRDWSESVTLFTHGGKPFTEKQLTKLREREVKIIETPVARLTARGQELTGVQLRDGQNIPLKGLFTAPRVTLNGVLVEKLGCEWEEGMFGPYIKTDALKATTVPGVFAAGDAARPTHNATWAAADGVTAGGAAHRSLIF